MGEGPANEGFGSVVSAGDFNGDGYGDVIGGAWNADEGAGGSTGAAYILFGLTSPPASIDASAADVIAIGADLTDRFSDSSGGGGR